MKYFCLLLIFLEVQLCLGQQDSIETIAKLMVAADYFEFSQKNGTCIDISQLESEMLTSSNLIDIQFVNVKFRDLNKLHFFFQKEFLQKENGNYIDFSFNIYKGFYSKKFNIDSINNIHYYENLIGLHKFKANEIPYQCDFIIAFVEGRVFKLKGFKYNEFAEFFYRYLHHNNAHITPSLYQKIVHLKGRKKDSALLENIKIDGLNMKNMYDNYVKKRAIFEVQSCYRRDWIINEY
ncbi:MAG: hypothetical protein R3E32_09310 [Chitinophagales bacterium]